MYDGTRDLNSKPFAELGHVVIKKNNNLYFKRVTPITMKYSP